MLNLSCVVVAWLCFFPFAVIHSLCCSALLPHKHKQFNLFWLSKTSTCSNSLRFYYSSFVLLTRSAPSIAANFAFPVSQWSSFIFIQHVTLALLLMCKVQEEKCDEKRISWMWNKKERCMHGRQGGRDESMSTMFLNWANADTRQGWMLSCFVCFPCCCFARPNFFFHFFFFHSAQPPKTKSSQATFYSTVTPSRLIWKLNFQSAESRLCWSNI